LDHTHIHHAQAKRLDVCSDYGSSTLDYGRYQLGYDWYWSRVSPTQAERYGRFPSYTFQTRDDDDGFSFSRGPHANDDGGSKSQTDDDGGAKSQTDDDGGAKSQTDDDGNGSSPVFGSSNVLYNDARCVYAAGAFSFRLSPSAFSSLEVVRLNGLFRLRRRVSVSIEEFSIALSLPEF
jgi:hypothetical protein